MSIHCFEIDPLDMEQLIAGKIGRTSTYCSTDKRRMGIGRDASRSGGINGWVIYGTVRSRGT